MIDQFPSLPPYKAIYAPIYLEPIMGSGERLTVAIAAVGYDEKFKVVQTLPEKVIECLYGNEKENFSGLIGVITSSAINHLREKQNLEYWEPPFTGAILGEITETYAADLNGVFVQALKMHSSLSHLPGTKSEVEEVEYNKKWWIDKIKDNFEQKNNRLFIQNFDKKFSFYKKYTAVETKYDYAGNHYVANISRLPFGRYLSNYVNDAKIKLFDLESIKKAASSDATLFPDKNISFELLLYMPPKYKRSKKASAAFHSLEEAGDDRELMVVSIQSPEEAYERILKAEKAA